MVGGLSIGGFLKSIRKAKGETLKVVAARVGGISISKVSRLESGLMPNKLDFNQLVQIYELNQEQAVRLGEMVGVIPLEMAGQLDNTGATSQDMVARIMSLYLRLPLESQLRIARMINAYLSDELEKNN